MLANYGKRIMAFLLAMILTFSLVPVQAFATEAEEVHDHDHEHETMEIVAEAETEEETEHEHDFVAGDVVAPSCTEDGYTLYSCACGESEKRDNTDALDHTYESKVVEPEVGKEGYTKHTCAVCGDSYKDSYVDALPEETTEKATEEATEEVTEEATEEVTEEATEETAKATEEATEETTKPVIADGEMDFEEDTIDPMMAASGNHTPIEGITVSVSGATDNSMSDGAVTVTAKGSGGFLGMGASSKTATIKISNTLDTAATISFNWTASSVNQLVIDGVTYTGGSGSWNKVFSAGETVTCTITTAKNGTTNKLVMNGFSITPVAASSKVTFSYNKALGSVTVAGVAIEPDGTADITAAGAEVVAKPNGSTFLGWADETGKILSTAATYTVVTASDMTIKAAFASPTTEAWFDVGSIGTTKINESVINWSGDSCNQINSQNYLFEGLGAALTYAQANGYKGIVPVSDGIITGSHTVPSGYVLLIPYSSSYLAPMAVPEYENRSIPNEANEYLYPKAYRTVTLAAGASLTVNGTLSVPAKIISPSGSKRGGCSPADTYGYLKLAEGSSVTVNSGANLSCYGYIGGSGTITAKSGSKVYEAFQYEDYRGGDQTTQLAKGQNQYRFFPMNSYYVMNILAPLTLEAGATESCYASITASYQSVGTSVTFISDSNAMFNLKKGSVTKKYDHANDRTIITANKGSKVDISNIRMAMGGGTINISIDSKDYDLPINGNMTVIIEENSEINLQQNVVMLPGAELIVNSGAKCNLSENASLFVFALDDWSYDATQIGIDPAYHASGWVSYVAPQNQPMFPQYYVPDRIKTRSAADLKDVQITVAGTVNADGYVYTTAGGAQIAGVEGAKISMKMGLANADHYQMIQHPTPSSSYFVKYTPTPNLESPLQERLMTTGRLRNADGSFADYKALEAAGSGTYTYTNGVWEFKCTTCTPGEAATCTTAQNCTVCGSEVVKALGHIATEGVSQTCTTGIPCGREGCTVEFKPALGHAEETIPGKAATCIATGLTEGKKCKTCGTVTVAQTEIPVADHTPSAAVKENIVEPTCLVGGSYDMVVYCSVSGCGKELERKFYTVDAKGHSYGDYKITKDPTCTDAGEKYAVCGNCEEGVEGYKIVETIDALGHNPGEAATCTTAQVCNDCGAEIAPALGHDMKHTAAVAATCTTDGVKEHWTCNTCGKSYWDKDGKTQIGEGESTVSNQLGHDVTDASPKEENRVEPTCTTDGGYDLVTRCVRKGCNAIVSSTHMVLKQTGHTADTPAEENRVESTCYAEGSYDLVTRCTVCKGDDGKGTIISSEKMTIGKLGHTIDVKEENRVESTCTVPGSYDKVTYCTVAECDYKVIEKQTLDLAEHALVDDARVEPTCTGTGLTAGSHCKNCTYVAVKQEDIPATGHKWDDKIIYTWSDDHKSCTATLKCNGNCTLEDKLLVVKGAVSEKTTAAVCGQSGKTTYTATFTNKDPYKDKLTTQTFEKTITALEHDWSDVTYTWAEDHSTCTATRTCKRDNCPVGTQSEEKTSNAKTTAATCTKDGQIVYTVVFSDDFGGEKTETVTTTAKGHSWGTPTYSWDTVNLKATATRECQNDFCNVGEGEKASETEEVVITKDVTPATCTEDGKEVYTAEFPEAFGGKKTHEVTLTHTGHTEVETKDYTNGKEATCNEAGWYDKVITCAICNVEISRTKWNENALGHKWSAITYTWDDDFNYTATRTCANGDACDAPESDKTETVKGVGVITEEQSCTTGGVKTYTGIFKNDIFNTDAQTSKLEILPALGHDVEKAAKTDKVEAECEKAGCEAYYQCTRTDCGLYFTDAALTQQIQKLDEWKKGDGKIAALEHIFTEYKPNNDATCTADGTETAKCVRFATCGKTHTRTKADSKLGHDWNEAEYVWTQVDGKWNCTATRTCKRDAGHIQTETKEATSNQTKAPTCETKGETTYTAAFETPFETQVKTESDIPARPHKLVAQDGKAATCTTDGWNGYFKCDNCGLFFSENNQTAKIGDAEALESWKTGDGKIGKSGHAWTYDYQWTLDEGEWKCTATRTCDNADHPETEKATVSVAPSTETGKAPTCTVKGWNVYTATFGAEGYTTQTKEVQDIPAVGHGDAKTTAKVDAKCESTGMEAYYQCGRCNLYFSDAALTAVIGNNAELANWKQTLVENGGGLIPATDHDYEEKITTPATCDSAGVKTFTCKNDPTHKYTETIAQLTHSFTKYESNGDAKCGVDGTKTAFCDHGCGEKDTVADVGSAREHDLKHIEAVPNTCEHAGNIEHWICQRESCGKYFTDANAENATTAAAVVLAQLEHEYNEVVTAPTCKDEGYTTHTCKNGCNDSYKDTYVNALGHKYDEGKQTTAPTCVMEGKMVYTCVNGCGDYYTEAIAKLGHSYDSGVQTIVPTCTEKGSITYTCTVCLEGTDGHTKTEEVKELGHWMFYEITKQPTCTETGLSGSGFCRRGCGYEEAGTVLDKLNHTWGAGTVTKQSSCTEEGELTQICTVCITATNKVPLPKASHITSIVVAKPATCTEDGHIEHYTCATCSNKFADANATEILASVVDPKTGHTTKMTPAKAATCLADGNIAYYTCQSCKLLFKDVKGETETTLEAVTIKTEGHKYDKVVTAPTCEADGYTTYTCPNCAVGTEGHSYVADPTDKLNHNWDEGVVTKNPGCLTTGIKTYTCQNDKSHTYTETIEEKGHDNDVVVTKPTCTAGGYTTKTCKVCGNIETTDKTEKLGHNLVKQDGQAATCTVDGFKAYYQCTIADDSRTCCGLYFEDEKGESPIDNLATWKTTEGEGLLKQTGHSFTNYISDGDATCLADGHKTAICDNACGEKDTVVDTGSMQKHNLVEQPGKAPTCTEDGFKAYFKCTSDNDKTNCGALFADAAGETPIADLDAWKAADGFQKRTGHSFTKYESNGDAKCGVDGTKTAICDNECGEKDTIKDEGSALKHSFTKYEPNGDAKCEVDGTKTATCDHGCGTKDTVTNEGSALKHSFTKYASNNDATCEADGTETAKCDRCDVTDTRTVADSALGHKTVLVEAKAVTCLVDGNNAYYTCENCTEVFKDKDATQKTTVEAETIKAKGSHTITSTVTDPGCTTQGYTTHTCSACDYVKVDTYTNPIGHSGQLVKGQDKTCTADGWKDYYQCANCELFYTEQACRNQIADLAAWKTGDGKLAAEGHKGQYIKGQDKTCTEDGWNAYYQCSVCEFYFTDEGCTTQIADLAAWKTGDGKIEALGHLERKVDGKAATCTVDGWNAYYQCTVCENFFSDEACEKQIADLKTWQTGDGKIEALGHKPGEATIENPVAATCTTDGSYDEVVYCSVCKTHEISRDKKVEPALKHDWIVDAAKAPTCTATGLTEGKHCSRCTEKVKQDVVPATGHLNKETIPGYAATCTATGMTDGEKCKDCGATVKAQVAIPVLKHKAVYNEGLKAGCENDGWKAYYQCSECKQYFEEYECKTVIADLDAWREGAGKDPAKGHDGKLVKGQAPTCTVDGWNDYYKCANCTLYYSDADCKNEIEDLDAWKKTEGEGLLKQTGHDEEILPAKDATCDDYGLKEGKKCKVCGVTTVEREIIPAKGHDMVTDAYKAPTCTETGLTAGEHCSRCDAKTIAQKEIPALGHKGKLIAAKAATCTEDGYKAHYQCSNCSLYYTDEACENPITDLDAWKTGDGKDAAKGHDEDILPAKDATCDDYGLTEGKKCKVCGITYVNREIIPALGHKEVVDEAKAATCTETGLTEGKHCGREGCGKIIVEQRSVKELGHIEVVDAAKAATCTETGLTEGKHCDREGCGEILVKQETVDATGHDGKLIAGQAATCAVDGWKDYYQCANCELFFAEETCQTQITDLETWKITEEQGLLKQLGHAWDEGRVTTLPTCTEEGIRTFTCGNCNGTQNAPEPALGHDPVQHPGKKPTYTTPGWEPYETCTRCDYNTMVAIPALGEAEIKTFDEFIENLAILETIADTYVKKVSPGKDPAMLIIKYIRTGVDRYNSGSWNIMAGYEDSDFASYVKKYEDEHNAALAEGEEMMMVTGLKNIHEFKLPNGDLADIGHVFGSMDITYTNRTSEDHADVSGWAGDTVDLMSMVDQFGWESTTIEGMVEEINKKYFLKYREEFEEEPIEGTFSNTDMEGDLDAFYVMQTLYGTEYENGTLTKIFKEYMNSSLTSKKRAKFFLNNRLGGVSLRSDVRDAVLNEYLANGVVSTLEGTRPFVTTKLDTLRKACCYVVADYLCRLAGDFVENKENEYFSVYQTETVTLAPGIVQKINYANSADGKTMAFYLATGDISRGDVHIYANYNNNDPAGGWEMQRVIDQANAAQKKYGDPESEQYIPNYNVIASINGAGYDMGTGEPSGILVMNGVEYHPIASSGFFGILDDGTAMIGSMADYIELQAERPGRVQEAIATFGDLIRDGKIVASDGGDRASRTAIGITATGKVVFMVLDGRLGDLSCGGNMREIAQIMLEAGCEIAVNLDGGGSSTYVAREPGATELSVVSRPSDGISRSVSTSLMMVSTAPSSNAFDHAVLESEYAYFTVDSTDKFTATAVSATGNVVDMPEDVQWVVADETIGAISDDGVFTAKGLGSTQVQLKLNGEVIGSKKVHVVNPDNVYFAKNALNAVYGEPKELPVRAVYEGKAVSINLADVILSLENVNAGVIDGFTFTGDAACGLKKVKVIATLACDPEVKASMFLSMFTKDEASFDFDNATGGDRQLAWEREVSNSTMNGVNVYHAIDLEKDMETRYTFAIDMSQIEMPTQLTDLVYMLPGADVEGNNSAWNFLLQLAERVSTLTEVTPVLYFDKDMQVDYSELSINTEYFTLKEAVFNEEESSLKLVMKWNRQTKPIDADTANPLCILSGIKLTPKDTATWNSNNAKTVVNKGTIGYDIYLRANALYSFSQKPENQEIYGLYPFQHIREDDGVQENGGHFQSVYKEFDDQYTLVNGVKDGWVIEGGGFAYYLDGEKYTGIREIDGLFYDFGENGINIGQKPYSGAMTDADGNEFYLVNGVKYTGWMLMNEQNVRYYHPETGVREELIKDEVLSTCIVAGHCVYTTQAGEVKRIQYDDPGGHEYVLQEDGSNVCSVCGFVRIELAEVTTTLSNYIYTYDGTAKKPASKAVTKDGIVLTKPSDTTHPEYLTTYENNVEVGTAKAVLKGKKYGKWANLTTFRGNVAGEVEIEYEIRPDAPTSAKAVKSGSKMKVSWSAVKAPGAVYVVYGSNNGTSWTKLSSTDKLSVTLKSYKFYQVGTFKTVDGKNYASVTRTDALADTLRIRTTNNAEGKPVLEWAPVKNAKSYTVYRATSKSGTYSKVYSSTKPGYTNTSAKASTTYYYKVKVTLKNGKVMTSNVVSNKWKIPAVVFSITMGNNAKGQPVVQWQKIAGAEKYTVYRATTKDGNFVKMLTTTKTSYTNTSAEVGKTYYYKVKVHLADGKTKTSEAYKGKYVLPAVVFNVTAGVDTQGKMLVKWDEIVGAKKYTLFRADTLNGEYVQIGTTTGTSLKDATAKRDTTYFYKLQVLRIDGVTTDSRAYVLRYEAPEIVFDITPSNNRWGRPRLSWTAIPGAVKYEIYRATTKNGTYTKMFTTSKTAYTNTDSEYVKTYYYKLKVYLKDGTTAISDPVQNTCIIPMSMFNIKTGNNAKGKPTLKWAKIKNAKQYVIYRATSEDGPFVKALTTTKRSYTNTAGVKGKTSYFKIEVILKNGTSWTSDVVSQKCK